MRQHQQMVGEVGAGGEGADRIDRAGNVFGDSGGVEQTRRSRVHRAGLAWAFQWWGRCADLTDGRYAFFSLRAVAGVMRHPDVVATRVIGMR